MTTSATAPYYRDTSPVTTDGLPYEDVPRGALIRVINNPVFEGYVFYKPHRRPWFRKDRPMVVGAPVLRGYTSAPAYLLNHRAGWIYCSYPEQHLWEVVTRLD